MTGPSGFLGINIVKYFGSEKKYEIFPLSVRYGDSIHVSSNCYIHLGGKAHHTKIKIISDEYYSANFLLTKELYDNFLIDEIAQCFIYMSSVKAIADTPGTEAVTELTIFSVNTEYGLTKKMAEDYIMGNLPAEGKRVYILRPCMIHGPGNKGNLNLLFKVGKLGIPYPLAAFENQRSYLSVENLCFIIKELIDRTDIPSGIYNVADDTPLSTNRVIQIMCEMLFKRPRLWKINKPFIRSIARIGDFLPLPLNTERLQKLTENYVVSNAKLLAAINKPLPVSSEEGLRKTIQSFADGK